MNWLFVKGGPQYWSFSFSISSSNEYSGLISFRIDWFDLLAVQGTSQEPSPTPQFKSISSSALNFIVRLSHLYMTTGKTIGLTRWTFVSKVMSLLFNMLSRLVIAFLLRSKCFLFHGCRHLNDFGAQENKIWHCFHCFPVYLP